jgi:hypothetical protein
MELNESILQIAKRYTEAKDHIATEEATKASLIMPFIQALGYDVYNPLEVVPEFNAEITGKKGDKVDYVIKKDGEVIILIECKWHGQQLDIAQESQLMRYFHALPSKKIAILTNGVQYRFYTDLDEKNKMDCKPFLQFEITSVNDVIVKELQRYTKTAFNIESIMPAAEELKYTGAIKKILLDSLIDPHEDFVKALANQVYEGKLTERMREKFKDIVKKAFNQFVSDRVSDRLSSALQEEKASANANEKSQEQIEGDGNDSSRVVTTQEEIDGYNIIKAILRQTVDAKRIAMRDTVSYCGILLDDNNRKTICRLLFNNPENLSIVLFDADKKESKHPLADVDDLYKLADEIIKNVAGIDKKSVRRGGKEESPADNSEFPAVTAE